MAAQQRVGDSCWLNRQGDGLEGTGHVQEHALVIVVQVRQVIREIGEVIAEADLEMIAEVS